MEKAIKAFKNICPEFTTRDLALLKAIECLLNPQQDDVVINVDINDLFSALEHASSLFTFSAVTESSVNEFKRLLGEIRPEFTAKDIETVSAWVAAGGLHYWKCSITLEHCIKHFVKWVAAARKEDKKLPSAIR